ncbi:hypothetical protein [Falsibacillus albus]|uniref:DUF1129 family protein n=1 Tax=Falsibacillus albus TaxID=2478915 RepID=A0A3L7JXN5_9BACI|nr:hypothetical protein [Falsibacillus albus]RLQ95536.1 hypothetical protein D9X91_10935 [Falsibacillus albus]
MIQCKDRYLKELEREMAFHPDKNNILSEYEVHVQELLDELLKEGIPEVEWEFYLSDRIGYPKEIAVLWQQEQSITPRKTQWIFMFINLCLFLGGSGLTFLYNWLHWTWIDQIWSGMTSVTSVIMLVYSLFWVLLGYEIGKEFGHGGKRLLIRTFIFTLLPNLVLMSLTVFRFIPYKWFEPLLDGPFILLCIVITLCLYPISWAGYCWGKRISV